ncbi:MAG TPA: S41 family peptidase [Terriglobia bacterium]|nr:S41 family peptidase [Terriglobia bacterium]
MPFHRLTLRWFFSLFAFLLFVLVPALAQTTTTGNDVTQSDLKLACVYQALQQFYTSPLDPDHAILDGAIRGMLATLDPFSAFFDRDQFEALQQQTRGEAVGFGSILFVKPGKILVLETAQGSPSWRAGLSPGDEITAINGTRIARLDLNSLVRLLQSAKSHPVTLEVIHPGHFVAQQYKLLPAEVNLPSVDEAFAYGKDIGYIRLASFDSKSPQEMADAINRLGGPSLDGLVLDLRNNHGGVLDAALGVASLFLPPGKLVLTVSGRAVPAKSYWTIPASAIYISKPLVLLVNGETASAAEVLAAALQDHDRALIVGEPTFGKGVVESVMGLSEKTGLALLTAEYFTPSGRSIQRPLPGTALANPDLGRAPGSVSRAAAETQAFHTDDGRPVTGGGGVTPDFAALPLRMDSWESFLDQRGLFTSFASDYLTTHGEVKKTFDPDQKVLADFKDYLNRQGILAPAKYWAKDQALLKTRIRTETISLVFGLDISNQIQTRHDPQVQKAVSILPQAPLLLKGPPKHFASILHQDVCP